MTDILNKVTVSAPAGNQSELVRCRYSYASDAGATGPLVVFEADGAVIVKDVMLLPKSALAGTGAALSVGISTNTDSMIDSVAISGLSVSGMIKASAGVPQYMADGDTLVLDIEAAALTAGIVELTFEVMKP
jgi:hypothetical protein